MPRTIATIGSNSTLAYPVIRELKSYGHTIIALTRAESPSLSALGVTVKPLDYNSVPALTAALQGVDTVISFMYTSDADSIIAANKALISAMKDAGVKRFAPSEWAFTKAANQFFHVYPPKDIIFDLAVEAGLEVTAFRVGVFMNYLAVGSTKPGVAEEGTLGVQLYTPVFIGAEAKAVIPGTGNEPIVFTRTQDIGKFVAQAVDFEKWEPEYGMVGEAITWNQLVDAAEKITGRKFERTYTSVKELEKQREQTEGFAKLFPELGLIMVNGMLDVKPDLNSKTDVKPMGVEEFLKLWWGA